MKVNSIILELSRTEVEVLNEEYIRAAAKIIASELSMQEIDELIEKLIIT